jgi:hypothetical protein
MYKTQRGYRVLTNDGDGRNKVDIAYPIHLAEDASEIVGMMREGTQTTDERGTRKLLWLEVKSHLTCWNWKGGGVW